MNRKPSAIEFVSVLSQDRNAHRTDRRRVLICHDELFEWLRGRRPNPEFDEDVLRYEARDGTFRTISSEEFLLARREADGRFQLKDGTSFYLIDEDGERWSP